MTTALKTATLALAREAHKKPTHGESLEQRALMQWAGMQAVPDAPDVERGAKVADYLFAIPNGGARSKIEAGIMKAEGTKAGVHDLQLPLPRGAHCGLWVEMKYGKNDLSGPQVKWKNRMELAGWKCVVCWSSSEAIHEVMGYLRTASAATVATK